MVYFFIIFCQNLVNFGLIFSEFLKKIHLSHRTGQHRNRNFFNTSWYRTGIFKSFSTSFSPTEYFHVDFALELEIDFCSLIVDFWVERNLVNLEIDLWYQLACSFWVCCNSCLEGERFDF